MYCGFIEVFIMTDNRRQSENLSLRARSMVDAGLSRSEVARRLGVHRSTIGRMLTRFAETGSDSRRRGQGRPRCTAPGDDRFLAISTLRTRTVTSTRLQQTLRSARGTNISRSTVRRRLREVNLASYRPAIVPRLRRQHRVARLAYARNHVDWTDAQWDRVLFSDETRVCLNSPDGCE